MCLTFFMLSKILLKLLIIHFKIKRVFPTFQKIAKYYVVNYIKKNTEKTKLKLISLQKPASVSSALWKTIRIPH